MMVVREVSSLVLASASPARARLLARARVPVVARASGIDEERIKREGRAAGLPPDDIVRQLATAKAMAVAADEPSAARVVGAVRSRSFSPIATPQRNAPPPRGR